jgi:hypothetical protein
MILIVSSARDEHTRVVYELLTRAGKQVQVLDLSRFPTHLQVSLHYQRGAGDSFLLKDVTGECIDLRDVRSIWWRRPQPFELHPEIQRPSFQTFAYNECYEAFAGIWQSLDVCWVNHPTRDEVAARKVFQLCAARDAGLQIPETLVSSDPSAVQEFLSSLDSQRVIYKSFSATEQEWRETRLLLPEEHASLQSVEYAPVIFQQYIEAAYDLRVTIVGNDIFAATIDSQSTSYPYDFRMEMDRAEIRSFELPSCVADQLRSLMKRLGIVYGAVDMRLTPEGEYVFLEINPAGQWLFIEQRTGQPISDSLASTLSASGLKH